MLLVILGNSVDVASVKVEADACEEESFVELGESVDGFTVLIVDAEVCEEDNIVVSVVSKVLGESDDEGSNVDVVVAVV